MNKKQATVAGTALTAFAGSQAGFIDAETGNVILAVLGFISALLPALLKGKRNA